MALGALFHPSFHFFLALLADIIYDLFISTMDKIKPML